MPLIAAPVPVKGPGGAASPSRFMTPGQLAAVPLPLLSGQGGDFGEATLLKFVLALVFVAGVASAVLAWRYGRALVAARRVVAAERALADRRGAVLAASTAGYWTWPGEGAPSEGGGALAHLLGVVPDSLGRFDDVVALLRRAHAAEVEELVARLRSSGSGFSLRVETADGRRVLDLRGLRTAMVAAGPACDTVWFRDVSDVVRESARLMERVSGLAAQNTGLRQVFDGLDVPVWVRGPDLSLVYCNRAYARAVEEPGPSAAIAAGKEIASGPAGWGRKLAQEALAAGEARRRSLYIVVEGSRRLLDITEFPIGANGAPWHMAGIGIDRTDADDARNELERHVAAHAEVLEKLGTGMVIFGPDARVQFFNAAFSQMWGLNPEWLREGPTHSEMLEDLRTRRMYPEQTDFQKYKQQRMELYTSLLDTQEELLHLPDGRVIRVVISPHPLGGLMFTSEDVTDRLTLERSYNTLIAVQSETLNNLHEGVAVYGSDGRLKLYNPAFARIWRLDPDLLEGEPRMAEVADAVKSLFVFKGNWESFRDYVLASSADRAARSGRFERADGSILDYAAVPLPDGAMLYTYIDVTDSVAVHRALRERNDALLAADRLKSEFITNVSYELRTPLNTIIGFTEILANQYFGTLNRRQAEYGQGILEASRQLLALIDNILDLALIESGQLDLKVGPTDIAAMLESVAVLAREQARKRGLSLDLQCENDIGLFIADERRIKQALFSLVSNAIKYTPAEGHIRLGARRDGDDVVLVVADTGTGIPAEDRDRVFDKFERGGAADGHGGIGLGLALVRSFVILHGGSVRLYSEPGEGTCIVLRLPAAPPAEAPRLTDGRAPWADPGADI
jgi:signal transduction histidine kinase